MAHTVPASQILLARAAERGSNLGAITSALIRLLDRNSAADLQAPNRAKASADADDRFSQRRAVYTRILATANS